MKAAKLPVSVLVVIYTPAREVLLIRRADHAEFWQSVTGSMEAFDTDLRQTAAREVQEETGLSVQPEDLQDWGIANVYEIYPAWRHRYAPGVTHNTEHVFGLCVPSALPVRLNPLEHTAWQWLQWRAAADLCYSASNAEAILHLPEFLSLRS
jgi:dATP pyrophosphohydrolase